MSLQWTIIALVLYGEIAFIITLLLPFIPSIFWLTLLKNQWIKSIIDYFRYFFYSFVGLVVVFFLDSIRIMYRQSNMLHNATISGLFQRALENDRYDMYLAQRNFYISGFSLFLFIVIYRLLEIHEHLAQLEDDASTGSSQNQFQIANTQNNDDLEDVDDLNIAEASRLALDSNDDDFPNHSRAANKSAHDDEANDSGFGGSFIGHSCHNVTTSECHTNDAVCHTSAEIITKDDGNDDNISMMLVNNDHKNENDDTSCLVNQDDIVTPASASSCYGIAVTTSPISLPSSSSKDTLYKQATNTSMSRESSSEISSNSSSSSSNKNNNLQKVISSSFPQNNNDHHTNNISKSHDKGNDIISLNNKKIAQVNGDLSNIPPVITTTTSQSVLSSSSSSSLSALSSSLSSQSKITNGTLTACNDSDHGDHDGNSITDIDSLKKNMQTPLNNSSHNTKNDDSSNNKLHDNFNHGNKGSVVVNYNNDYKNFDHHNHHSKHVVTQKNDIPDYNVNLTSSTLVSKEE